MLDVLDFIKSNKDYSRRDDIERKRNKKDLVISISHDVNSEMYKSGNESRPEGELVRNYMFPKEKKINFQNSASVKKMAVDLKKIEKSKRNLEALALMVVLLKKAQSLENKKLVKVVRRSFKKKRKKKEKTGAEFIMDLFIKCFK